MNTINARTHLFDTLATVDQWSQLSCLGSMTFTITAEAIRKAIKLIPDHPTPDTVEAFLNEERNRKLDVEYAGNTLGDGTVRGDRVPLTQSVADVSTTPGNYYEARRELSALLELRQTMLDLSDEVAAAAGADGSERTLLNTLQFMLTQLKFDPVAAARQYAQNMKLGMKNYGQTRTQYVEQERLRAARSAEDFVAKGEHAVQFLEGLDLTEGDISDKLMDTLYRRCVAKLIVRRQKIGQTLSWRTDPAQRQQAEADILFIEEAIIALDGDIPAEAVVPPEAEVDDIVHQAPAPAFDMAQAMAAFAQAFAAQAPTTVAGPALSKSYRVPGPVTITH